MKPIVYDLETSISKGTHGPDFRDPTNDFYTLIYGNNPQNIVVEHKKEGFGRQLSQGFIEQLAVSDVIVGHNLGFDLSYVFHLKEIRDFISRGGVIWDTQVAEYILTAQQHQYSSLADLQEKYLGEKKKIDRISQLYAKGIGADVILSKRLTHTRLFSIYDEYCRLDGSTTLKIFKQQYIRAKQENMLPIVQLYQDYLLSLINMTTTGIKLDLTQCEKTLTEFNLKHLEYLEQAQNLIKPLWKNPRLPKFNINSPDHKSAILFGGEIKTEETVKTGYFKPKTIYEEVETGEYVEIEYYDEENDNYYTKQQPVLKRIKVGMEDPGPKYKKVQVKIWVDGFQIDKSLTRPTKKAGVYVTDNTVMLNIAATTRQETVKKYCELQKEAMMYKKAAKTYVEAFINLSVDGVLYPNFNNVATSTGRLSSSKPNMQNVSKRNKFGKTLHKLFVAPEGWKCVQIDFSQLEIFVMAWLSGDTQLREHLLNNVDMHCVRLGYYNEDKTYEELYKLCKTDKDPYWDGERSKAKTVSYQMAYGAMPPKVAESTGLPLETVELIFAKEAETYPRTVQLSEQVMASIKRTVNFSFAKNIPGSQKKGVNGSKFKNGIELLPIFDKAGSVCYNGNEYRKIGYWTSPTGKKYHFLQNGRMYKGSVSKSFSFTQPKNYPMQGTAADIQGATTAELLKLLIAHPDKIRMINEVHDSKWFYVKEEHLSHIIPMIRGKIEDVAAIFKRRFSIDVPFRFPVDIEIGDNFAEMEKI